eukprot:TRINITY_DN8868_c0_g1_i1.p1 TRINITY_DN8868_c0_g1~~TRINITY_DN8868_c0_g1_i1.p1  ORF type:complete len:128 (+),score=9.99 TRINITY_DN8868_c0_g1_i1:39-422(+)
MSQPQYTVYSVPQTYAPYPQYTSTPLMAQTVNDNATVARLQDLKRLNLVSIMSILIPFLAPFYLPIVISALQATPELHTDQTIRSARDMYLIAWFFHILVILFPFGWIILMIAVGILDAHLNKLCGF